MEASSNKNRLTQTGQNLWEIQAFKFRPMPHVLPPLCRGPFHECPREASNQQQSNQPAQGTLTPHGEEVPMDSKLLNAWSCKWLEHPLSVSIWWVGWLRLALIFRTQVIKSSSDLDRHTTRGS
jgi:hypothetical protein